jgi:hypothetical protein
MRHLPGKAIMSPDYNKRAIFPLHAQIAAGKSPWAEERIKAAY